MYQQAVMDKMREFGSLRGMVYERIWVYTSIVRKILHIFLSSKNKSASVKSREVMVESKDVVPCTWLLLSSVVNTFMVWCRRLFFKEVMQFKRQSMTQIIFDI